MSATSSPSVRENPEPPAPDAVFAVVNPLMKLLLRSPLHGLVSDDLMLITFEGRRSGKQYTTPVGYHLVDDEESSDGRTVLAFTHSPWWRNLRGGRPVRLRLRGEDRTGIATPRTDPETVGTYVRRLIDAHGVDRVRRLGFEIDGDEPPTAAQIADAVEETVAIEIELEHGS